MGVIDIENQLDKGFLRSAVQRPGDGDDEVEVEVCGEGGDDDRDSDAIYTSSRRRRERRHSASAFAVDERSAEEVERARRLRLLRKSERLFDKDVVAHKKVVLKKRGLVLSDFM